MIEIFFYSLIFNISYNQQFMHVKTLFNVIKKLKKFDAFKNLKKYIKKKEI